MFANKKTITQKEIEAMKQQKAEQEQRIKLNRVQELIDLFNGTFKSKEAIQKQAKWQTLGDSLQNEKLEIVSTFVQVLAKSWEADMNQRVQEVVKKELAEKNINDIF